MRVLKYLFTYLQIYFIVIKFYTFDQIVNGDKESNCSNQVYKLRSGPKGMVIPLVIGNFRKGQLCISIVFICFALKSFLKRLKKKLMCPE